MTESRKRGSRSASLEMDSDIDNIDGDGHDEDHMPGKPGRKKNPNSQAARRDQNRIAQREFRLRKQQRIRDLEARVEMLSGTKDETYSHMRDIIRDLIAENRTLRNMVRGLSTFIGDGAGGAIATMGWSLKEYEDFINKADTDTAYEAFVRHKKAKQVTGISTGEKRPAMDDPDSRKRSKITNEYNPGDITFSSGLGSDFSAYETDPSMSLFQSIRPPPNYTSNFINSLTDPQGNPNTFLTGTSTSSGLGFATTSTNGRDPFSAYQSGTNTPSQTSTSPATLAPQTQAAFLPMAPPGTSPNVQSSTPSAHSGDDSLLEDPKAQEARKLIAYHLDNYRRNTAYCLPPSLRPTLIQRTVPHEGIIDGIVHPEIRNRMILLRGRFSLADCIHNYLKLTTIHGDDVLAHANWEIHEEWLRQYGDLLDSQTLALTNRWRKERGETEIPYTEISTSEQIPGATVTQPVPQD